MLAIGSRVTALLKVQPLIMVLIRKFRDKYHSCCIENGNFTWFRLMNFYPFSMQHFGWYLSQISLLPILLVKSRLHVNWCLSIILHAKYLTVIVYDDDFIAVYYQVPLAPVML